MSKDIEKAIKFMEKIAADNSHGYDQTKRNGGIDYDCSSLVGTALHNAGFNVSCASTTRNLHSQLLACGFEPCEKPFKRGDIHLNIAHHVVMSVDMERIVHASINEKGTGAGGTQGDQTGKEICVRSYYEYPKGWDYHLRYSGGGSDDGSASVDGSGSADKEEYDMPTIKKGSKSKAVKIWQIIIGVASDGDFGSNTLKATQIWQASVGLAADGIVGAKSWKKGFDSL